MLFPDGWSLWFAFGAQGVLTSMSYGKPDGLLDALNELLRPGDDGARMLACVCSCVRGHASGEAGDCSATGSSLMTDRDDRRAGQIDRQREMLGIGFGG